MEVGHKFSVVNNGRGMLVQHITLLLWQYSCTLLEFAQQRNLLCSEHAHKDANSAFTDMWRLFDGEHA